MLSVNALCAADELVIPFNSQAMALSGVVQLKATLEELCDAEVIQRLPNMHLLMTIYDRRRALARKVRDYLSGRDSGDVYAATIRASARIVECYGHHQTIYDYAPREGVAEDYTRLAEELQLAVSSRWPSTAAKDWSCAVCEFYLGSRETKRRFNVKNVRPLKRQSVKNSQ